jgi:sulfhydrogenase subunit beta (sulfur reductase)
MKVEEVRPEMNETVIFGIRPCDAKGIQLLDAVFSGANADPYYWDRRNKVLLVGLACNEPHYNCFCTTVGGSPHGTDGLDVLLTEIEGGMYALAVTPRGGEMVVGGPFEKASDAQRTEAEKVHGASVEAFARRSENGPIDAEALIKRLEGMFDDPYWDQTASRCLGCGACAYLCPTCHCFDINDEGGQAQGRRVRTWDTCQFADFTLHSSSHNPRPVKKNRIRQRVYHKFKYIPENLGDLGCVGCGRCITHCPVNIDIFKVLLDIEEVGP